MAIQNIFGNCQVFVKFSRQKCLQHRVAGIFAVIENGER
jgi:hypothetical protein